MVRILGTYQILAFFICTIGAEVLNKRFPTESKKTAWIHRVRVSDRDGGRFRKYQPNPLVEPLSCYHVDELFTKLSATDTIQQEIYRIIGKGYKKNYHTE